MEDCNDKIFNTRINSNGWKLSPLDCDPWTVIFRPKFGSKLCFTAGSGSSEGDAGRQDGEDEEDGGREGGDKPERDQGSGAPGRDSKGDGERGRRGGGHPAGKTLDSDSIKQYHNVKQNSTASKR